MPRQNSFPPGSRTDKSPASPLPNSEITPLVFRTPTFARRETKYLGKTSYQAGKGRFGDGERKRIRPSHLRDAAPILFDPGTEFHYSNTGFAALSLAVAASLRFSTDDEVRTLLRKRIMDPLGIPQSEWSCGYGKTAEFDGLSVVPNWGGGNYSANAAARVARLMLRKGEWEGKQLISQEAVESVTHHAPGPLHGAIGWWTNAKGYLGNIPTNAFCALGAGNQVVLVVPEWDLIMVRNGGELEPGLGFDASSPVLRQLLFNPLVEAVVDHDEITESVPVPYPQSTVVTGIEWAPVESIVRKAQGSDNWPLTWGDDDALYTAYGDGWGFDPIVEKKLSLGLAKVTGGTSVSSFKAENIRSQTAERTGQGPHGPKASGILMVDGVLYMWVRNTDNSQLAYSEDRGKHWTWLDWKFETSFGAPTLLNFGRNYEGARDAFVYLYSHESDSAYEPADSMVLARVSKDRITDRKSYEFFKGLDYRGDPLWTENIEERGPVFIHYSQCYRRGISYNPGLDRYLWCQILPKSGHKSGTRYQGGFGIYESAEPWGPWRTVFYTTDWDVGPGETSSFPTKWMSKDGKTLHLVFSGDDFFSIRRAELR